MRNRLGESQTNIGPGIQRWIGAFRPKNIANYSRGLHNVYVLLASFEMQICLELLCKLDGQSHAKSSLLLIPGRTFYLITIRIDSMAALVLKQNPFFSRTTIQCRVESEISVPRMQSFRGHYKRQSQSSWFCSRCFVFSLRWNWALE